MATAPQVEEVAGRTSAKKFDVIVVGAGLSGIAAARYLKTRTPQKTFTILESRDRIGGTWDLFRFPGVRSDSDMHTLGYSFRPWPSVQSIGGGPVILQYIRDTARADQSDRQIRFGHRVVKASWNSAGACWTLDVAVAPEGIVERFTCGFLLMCTGYYDYADGYLPDWPERERFKGRFVHPQHWPDDLDYAGKRVVIIGSGATAVTLAPAMAETAAHVIMLQRSPTYIVARPAIDPLASWAKRRLPASLAAPLLRWKNILLGMWFFNYARKKPETVKKQIAQGVRRFLGPDYDIETHFTPRYNPWDQRLCLVPDADFFQAIRSGKLSVATDHIERFTETGLRLRSGQTLDADIIVSATGLKLQMMGGMDVEVDGRSVDFAKTMNYKGTMYSDVPNLASAFGYTNASWTLKCELTARYVCRLLNYMDAKGYAYGTPRQLDPSLGERPTLDFTSGYILRARDVLPKQGTRRPWRLHQNYLQDLVWLRFGRVADKAMEFVPKRS